MQNQRKKKRKEVTYKTKSNQANWNQNEKCKNAKIGQIKMRPKAFIEPTNEQGDKEIKNMNMKRPKGMINIEQIYMYMYTELLSSGNKCNKNLQ